MKTILIGYLIFSALLTVASCLWMAWTDYKHGPDHKFGYSLRYNRGYPYFLGIPDLTWLALFFTLPFVNILTLLALFIHFLKFTVFKNSWGANG